LSRLVHIRGDVGSMFLFFLVLFAGLWQLLVAWKELNGLSITGYPDRRVASALAGVILVAGSFFWYFSGEGHFASPDVEGIESFALLLAGLMAATALQAVLASVLFRGRYRCGSPLSATTYPERNPQGRCQEQAVEIEVEGESMPALLVSPDCETPAGKALLLHDYGRDRMSLLPLALRLAGDGIAVLSIDLDGHGENFRPVTDPSMSGLIESALDYLEGIPGGGMFAAGCGFGGLLCLQAVSEDGRLTRAVALDPFPRDSTGYPIVNCLRELKPSDAVKEFVSPTARGAGGYRLDLATMVGRLPVIRAEGSLVIGTRDAYFNSPGEIALFADYVTGRNPLLVSGRHATIAAEGGAMNAAVSELCRVIRGPRARRA
jgi:pimeloyl-ACP methyl ester carboxylesterase